MNILSFDTSTNQCVVHLFSKNCNYNYTVKQARHDKCLLDGIDQVLKQAGLKLSDLDCIACGVGPGSFTGIRIGVSLANAFMSCLNIPIIPFSSLYAIALTAYHSSLVIYDKYTVLRDSYSTYFYHGEYSIKNGDLVINQESLLDKGQELHLVETGIIITDCEVVLKSKKNSLLQELNLRYIKHYIETELQFGLAPKLIFLKPQYH